MDNGTAVMVTTKHRGVFFGYLNERPADDVIVLDRARMAVYWSADLKGVPGLASHGPTSGCRISHALTKPVELRGVTGVFGVSEEAVERWEEAPWS